MTRGIRNNNPCNIRKGDEWKGLRAVQTDKAFCQFESMVMGLRAVFKTLKTYRDKHGVSTVSGIIERWAPASDGNNTKAYIAAVEKRSGIDRHASLGKTPVLYMKLVRAMCWVESLYVPNEDDIRSAYEMVF